MDGWQLRQMQSLPLEAKVIKSNLRIKEWYDHWEGEVCVSFSGGKDSTVLLHLVRQMYPDVPGVFVDTGLEYPEIRQFVKKVENVVWVKPDMHFKDVINKYGYPVISKRIAQYVRESRTRTGNNDATIRLRTTGIKPDGSLSKCSKIPDKWLFLREAPFAISDKCCRVMKKAPLDNYSKETGQMPFVGVMAADGANRELSYLQTGCNAFGSKRPKSTPLGFWLEKDIWAYLDGHDVSYSEIYDKGYPRTGCMFCAFGAHLEPYPNRFQRMYYTHPKLYHYCIDKLGLGEVLDYCGVDYHPRGLQLELPSEEGD